MAKKQKKTTKKSKKKAVASGLVAIVASAGLATAVAACDTGADASVSDDEAEEIEDDSLFIDSPPDSSPKEWQE
jgi:hypothetical protein